MKKTQSAGGIILNAKGAIVLVKNGPNFWGFPKGHVDPGEESLAAAKREIQEETGLTDLVLIRAYPTYERYKGAPGGADDMTELKEIHMFLFATSQMELMSQDPHNPEAMWFPAESVLETLTHQKDRDFFKFANLTR